MTSLVKPWFRTLFRAYVRRKLRRSLDGVLVSGLERTRAAVARGPIVLAANHVSWWDPLLLLGLDEALGATGHCLMDAGNLARLPFFGWVGAVPVDRQNPRAAARQVRAASRLLDRPGGTMWIFPQGEQRAAHLRPLGFHSGVQALVRQSDAPVVPVSIQYLFREQPEPTAYVHFGPVGLLDRGRAALADLESQVVDGLEAIDAQRRGERRDFEPLFDEPKGHRVPAGGRLLAALANRGDAR